MQPAKEIALNPKLTSLLSDIRNALKETHEKNQMLNTRLNDLLTGVCFNEGLNFEDSDIRFDDGLTKIIVAPKDKSDVESEEEMPVRKTATKRKLK